MQKLLIFFCILVLSASSLATDKKSQTMPPSPTKSLSSDNSEISFSEIQNEIPKDCDSFKVYKDTVDYLKTQEALAFTEPQILAAALEINSGCDGADKRFKKIFELLLKSGVNIKKSFDLALDFSKLNDQKTENFVVLFRGLFLENTFDFDFYTAYRISLELSAGYPKEWEKIKKDFKLFLEYCQKASAEDLPIRICAEWTLNILKHEPLFKDGIYQTFNNLNNFLLKKEGPQLPVRDRLKLISKIISYGPKASDNFQQALNWFSSKKGAGLKPSKAHQLALEIAKNSIKPIEGNFIKDKIPKVQ